MNIAKLLRTLFLLNTSRCIRLQMFFIIGVFKSFANFAGKHLCYSIFLKNLQSESLRLHKKDSNTGGVFLRSLRNFSYRTPPVAASTPPVATSVFFKKVLLNSYFSTLLWRTNIFFFSTYRLMYKKLSWFVYKFVVNCQFFK